MMKVGWIELNIEEISKSIFAGGDVDKSNLSNYRTEEFNIPIYTNGEKNDGLYGFTNIARVTEDAITVSARGTIGFTCIRNEPYYPAVRLINIIPNEKIDLNYLCYFIKNKTVLHTGSSIPQLTVPMVKKFKIGIPEKISEQQKIVEKLDTAFELIEQAKANIEKNIQNAKELFQSKLNDVFSQKAVGWKEIQLGDIGKVSMCKRIMKDQTLPEGDIPFYKIGTFGKEPNAFISKEIFNEYSTKYSYPKKGEILLSASGTIGRCVVFDGEPSFFQDSNIVWISNDEKLVLNEFLSQFYKICDWNPSKGATISRLYNSDLRRIKMSFPNIEEQRKLIPRFEKLEQQTELLQKKYKQKLSNLEELKKSVLEKAFKGELV